MMRLIIILTTDLKIAITKDVSEDNEVFNITSNQLPENHIIAGVSWILSSRCLNEARTSVLKLIYSDIFQKLDGYALWYFVGNSAWQPDTKIVRYRKLWGGLKARGVDILHACNSHEQILERKGRLKFFGAKRISELSIESVIKSIAEEHCSYLVALPENSDVKLALHNGWCLDNVFDKKLMQYVLDNNGVLLKIVGEFDDVESGFVGLGDMELLEQII